MRVTRARGYHVALRSRQLSLLREGFPGAPPVAKAKWRCGREGHSCERQQDDEKARQPRQERGGHNRGWQERKREE